MKFTILFIGVILFCGMMELLVEGATAFEWMAGIALAISIECALRTDKEKV